MRSIGANLAVWGLALAAGALVAGCGGGERTPADAPVAVVSSIFPLADAAKAVGGDRVTVSVLLPPAQTPHGFEPKPRQVEAVARARLLLTVGLGMDVWAERAAEAAGRPGLVVLQFHDAVSATPIRVEPHAHAQSALADEHGHQPGADEDEEETHAHESGDPHLWLDPVLMEAYVRALADELARLDPAHAPDYRARHEAYRAELEQLHADYERTLATARVRAFVSFHSAFTYAAARYGLTQAAVFEAERGGGVGPKHLESVMAFIREHAIKVIFAEPQFPADRLKPLVDATGVRVATLDPLGDPNVPGRNTYLALMRANLAALAEALECANGPPTPHPAP